MDAEKQLIASESCHWYDRDGNPQYSVIGKNGKERPTTITDARKNDWVPSVTTITTLAARPGLEAWKQRQLLMAALTLPRLNGEDDEAFAKRVIQDSQEQARKAAERGTALHAAIELYAQGKPFDDSWSNHVGAVEDCLQNYLGATLSNGDTEHTFAHKSGFGGKIDWRLNKYEPFDGVIVDFKTKQTLNGQKQLAWDEHRIQLAAYAKGIGLTNPRGINVFIGIEDIAVKIVEWSPEELAEGLTIFQHLLAIWKLRNGR